MLRNNPHCKLVFLNIPLELPGQNNQQSPRMLDKVEQSLFATSNDLRIALNSSSSQTPPSAIVRQCLTVQLTLLLLLCEWLNDCPDLMVGN